MQTTQNQQAFNYSMQNGIAPPPGMQQPYQQQANYNPATDPYQGIYNPPTQGEQTSGLLGSQTNPFQSVQDLQGFLMRAYPAQGSQYQYKDAQGNLQTYTFGSGQTPWFNGTTQTTANPFGGMNTYTEPSTYTPIPYSNPTGSQTNPYQSINIGYNQGWQDDWRSALALQGPNIDSGDVYSLAAQQGMRTMQGLAEDPFFLNQRQLDTMLHRNGGQMPTQGDPEYAQYQTLMAEREQLTAEREAELRRQLASRGGSGTTSGGSGSGGSGSGGSGGFEWPDFEDIFGDLFPNGTPTIPGGGTGGGTGGAGGGLTNVMTPQIPLDPIFTPDMIRQMTNRAVGGNETTYATEMENARRGFGNSGFSTNSPALRDVGNRLDLNRQIANTQARTQVPIQAAQANASHILQSLAENAKQRGLDISVYTALVNAQNGMLSPLFGLLGGAF